MKKALLIFLVAAFFGAFFWVVFGFSIPGVIFVENQANVDIGGHAKTKDVEQGVKETANEGDDLIKINAVGDIMLDRGIEYIINKEGGGDYKFPFLKIADYLKNADVVLGNLESQISDKGVNIGTVNSFRAKPEAINGLKYAGFTILSVANNHVLDYDLPAFEDSLKRLKDNGIEYIGGGYNKEEAFGLKKIEVRGTKIGFLAYCAIGSNWWTAEDNRSGIAFISKKDIPVIKEAIKKAKEQVDVLIVSIHLGTEYSTVPDDSQVLFDQSFAEAGADLVIGHHPHVAQFIEYFSPQWIAYSLGNFVFDQGFSTNTMKGLVLEINIKGKKIQNVAPKEIKMNKNFQPELTNQDPEAYLK
jgi:poly-gamma-glutamate synthesis protein (capsule biosynthesis protein)